MALRKEDIETQNEFLALTKEEVAKSKNGELESVLYKKIRASNKLTKLAVEYGILAAIRYTHYSNRRSVVKNSSNPDAPEKMLALSKRWLSNYYLNGKRLKNASASDLRIEIKRCESSVKTLQSKKKFLELISKEITDDAPIGGQISEERISVLASVAGYAHS